MNLQPKHFLLNFVTFQKNFAHVRHSYLYNFHESSTAIKVSTVSNSSINAIQKYNINQSCYTMSKKVMD